MKYTFRWLATCLVILTASGAVMAADLQFGRFFSDNMVLQRDKPVIIRGVATPEAMVTVTFAGQRKTVAAEANGIWTATLGPLAASTAGQSLAATAAGEIATIKNIVVGDVFIFARQTSIDISLGKDEEGQKVAAKVETNPFLRTIIIKTIPAAEPQSDLEPAATAGWTMVDKGSAAQMSAAAFYLGRNLATDAGVPIGIVDLNLGSAFPISWLSREALEGTEKLYGKSDVPGQLAYFDKIFEADKKGEPRQKGAISGDPIKYALFPSGGYNAVLAPLKGVAIKGAIIQLGNDYPYMIYDDLEKNGTHLDRSELNRAYVETYTIRKVGFRMEPVTTPRIPREWRDVFADETLPIGLVIPPGSDLHTLGEHHREMREFQRQMAEEDSAIGVILPGSENVLFSAQPSDEVLLGKRCLNWIKGAVYEDADTSASGPLFDRLETHFNEATVYFKEGTAKGLSARGDALNYFEAAGVEAKYSPVKATIDGETIHLKSDTVPRIVHIRYNWNKRPDEGLINAAGLPAIPFRTETAPYFWFVTNEESDLPIEYSTPANEWEKNDVTLVNGQLKTHGYDNFSGWLGPVGVRTGPFGPNMGVREVKPGSPAEGELFEGDVIYSANGNMLGEKAWEVMAAAITQSETREEDGELVLGVRRDGKNLDVEITLEVMGTYSPTAPYDCPKTEKIIADLENWVVSQGAGAGYLNTDAIFLLATGDPELQGYVRRIVYKIMAGMDPNKEIEPTKGMKSWHSSANALLFGEYYLATGDRNVLPYLKWFCDRLTATQNPLGGWRHNFPGGATYGLIPNAGLPGVMGMHFAIESGLDISRESYQLGLKHFSEKRAETGFLIYGFGGCEREIPAPFDPEAMATGHMNSYNGGLSAAGILMGFAGKYRAAHLCSLISAYAWNNTFHGHGGNFWNNFWTPLGAHAHSRAAFINFWKNYRWYRECNRMFDGSLIQHESGKVGAGAGVALVAPRQRIQIVGAPASPFAVDAPGFLKPAVDAYNAKDYAQAEALANELIDSGTVAKDDLPTVEYLARAADEIQESITTDLARMQKLIKDGNPGEAKSFIPELTGVMPEGDQRLATIQKAIASTRPVAKIVLDDAAGDAPNEVEEVREWQCLVTEITTDQSKGKGDYALGKVSPEEANIWRMKVVEDLVQAPEGWEEPKFDDSAWYESHLPISWRMYHTALLRTKFNVEDKKAFDGLRFRGWLFRQQGIQIYLNGELIGKVNNLEKKTGDVMAEFKESALKHLKSGENTLAVTTRHNWRWGMLFMRVYNDGFGFRLDARKK